MGATTQLAPRQSSLGVGAQHRLQCGGGDTKGAAIARIYLELCLFVRLDRAG